MTGTQYVKDKILLLFLIYCLSASIFYLRDSSFEMYLPILSRFCIIFFLLQSKVFCFLGNLQDACWWCDGPLLKEKALTKLLDFPYIFFNATLWYFSFCSFSVLTLTFSCASMRGDMLCLEKKRQVQYEVWSSFCSKTENVQNKPSISNW